MLKSNLAGVTFAPRPSGLSEEIQAIDAAIATLQKIRQEKITRAYRDMSTPAVEATTPGEELFNISLLTKKTAMRALVKTGNNRTQAANLMGITVRTLRNYIREWKRDGLSLLQK